LIAGFADLSEITAQELMTLLEDAGRSTDDGFVVHLDSVSVLGDEVFRVRARQRPHVAQNRLPDAQHSVIARIQDDAGFRSDGIADSLGDKLYIVCLETDTVGSVARSTDEGEPFVAVVAQSTHVVSIAMQPLKDAADLKPGAKVLARSMTFRQVLEAHGLAEVERKETLQFA
jgi:hypothetical protein